MKMKIVYIISHFFLTRIKPITLIALDPQLVRKLIQLENSI